MESVIEYVLVFFATLLIMLNIIATYIVLRTYFEVKERKAYQLIFIWFVPYIGALMVIFINREDYFQQKSSSKIGGGSGFTDNDVIDHYRGGNHHGGR